MFVFIACSPCDLEQVTEPLCDLEQVTELGCASVFSICKMGIMTQPTSTGCGGRDEFLYVKCLESCLAHEKPSSPSY